MNHQVYVISAGRYEKLTMSDIQKKEYIFCVPVGQGDLYQKHGCKNVIETGSLIDSRNFALDNAFEKNLICVQLSDDLKKIHVNKNFGEKKELDHFETIKKMADLFDKTSGIYLMGIPPTSNDFFAKNLIQENAFCIGDMLFVKPSKPRFDKNLTLKEDYDFTLQHIELYKKVIRYQKYIFEFQHYSNDGGAVAYRTDEKEQTNINYLLKKWPQFISLNKKRKNEILMRVK